jgi:hypothetical protein
MPPAIDWHRATDGLQIGDVHVTVRYRSFSVLEIARPSRVVGIVPKRRRPSWPPIRTSTQFRLGVAKLVPSAIPIRPSVHRQTADDVSRAAMTGPMDTQLARVSMVSRLV